MKTHEQNKNVALKEPNVDILYKLQDIITNKINGFFDLDNVKNEHLLDSCNPDYQVIKCTPDSLNWSSLHKHQYSVEHFIVLEGKLEVKIGQDNIFLKSGKTTKIPINVPHKTRALSENTIFLAILVPAEKEYMNEQG